MSSYRCAWSLFVFIFLYFQIVETVQYVDVSAACFLCLSPGWHLSAFPLPERSPSPGTLDGCSRPNSSSTQDSLGLESCLFGRSQVLPCPR